MQINLYRRNGVCSCNSVALSSGPMSEERTNYLRRTQGRIEEQKGDEENGTEMDDYDGNHYHRHQHHATRE